MIVSHFLLFPSIAISFADPGTHKEVQNDLSKYGISSMSSSNNSNPTVGGGRGLPIDENGTLETSLHSSYLEQLTRQDYSELSFQQQQSPSVVAAAAAVTSLLTVAAGISTSRPDDGSVTGSGGMPGVPKVTTPIHGGKSQNEDKANKVSTPKTTNSNASIEDTQYHEHNDIDDSATAVEKRIYKPGPDDVLLGRGKQYQDHSGNVQLVKLVERYRRSYHASTNNVDKTCINQLIVQMIHEKGGKFLERNKTTGGSGGSSKSKKTSTTAGGGGGETMSNTVQGRQTGDGDGRSSKKSGDNFWVEVTNDKAWAKVSRYFRQW